MAYDPKTRVRVILAAYCTSEACSVIDESGSVSALLSRMTGRRNAGTLIGFMRKLEAEGIFEIDPDREPRPKKTFEFRLTKTGIEEAERLLERSGFRRSLLGRMFWMTAGLPGDPPAVPEPGVTISGHELVILHSEAAEERLYGTSLKAA